MRLDVVSSASNEITGVEHREQSDQGNGFADYWRAGAGIEHLIVGKPMEFWRHQAKINWEVSREG